LEILGGFGDFGRFGNQTPTAALGLQRAKNKKAKGKKS